MKNYINYFLSVLTVFTFTILYGCGGASPDYRVYENILNTQMQSMINVLNAGHYQEFMTTYVDPAYITSQGGIDQAMLKFDNKRREQLYNTLRTAKNVSPLYDENKKVMTYAGTTLTKPLAFKLINNKWYLLGDWFR